MKIYFGMVAWNSDIKKKGIRTMKGMVKSVNNSGKSLNSTAE